MRARLVGGDQLDVFMIADQCDQYRVRDRPSRDRNTGSSQQVRAPAELSHPLERLVDALDDECDVVCRCCADQCGDEVVGDVLDGFVANGDCDVGEATEAHFEIFVASLDQAVGVEDEQVVGLHVELCFRPCRCINCEWGSGA